MNLCSYCVQNKNFYLLKFNLTVIIDHFIWSFFVFLFQIFTEVARVEVKNAKLEKCNFKKCRVKRHFYLKVSRFYNILDF